MINNLLTFIAILACYGLKSLPAEAAECGWSGSVSEIIILKTITLSYNNTLWKSSLKDRIASRLMTLCVRVM